MDSLKYTKKHREQAALILQVAASNDSSISQAAKHLGIRSEYAYDTDPLTPAENLAQRAYYSEDTPVGDMREHTYAYAEALVRTGWVPE